MRRTCLAQIYELARRDSRVVFIGSDISRDQTLDRFRAEMPERFFLEGVSEAHLVGMMAGLAANGRIPYANTIATFMTRRCYEQIALDACLHRWPIRLIGSGGGLVYAPLGPTHLAIDDLAIMRALPNMAVVAVADAEEMKRLMPQTLHWPGPMYIRLAKGGDPVVSRADCGFEIGKAIVMRAGVDALIVSTGVMLSRALEAAEGLDASVGVLHVHTLKPFDRDGLLAACAPVRAVVAVEEHSVTGGLGSAVAEVLAEAGFDPGKNFLRLGIPDVFPDKYGSQELLLAEYGLTAPGLAAAVRRLLPGVSAALTGPE